MNARGRPAPRLAVACAAGLLALGAALPARAADDALQTPLRDPWVPPAAARAAAAEPRAAPPRGEALRRQVLDKLRARFDAADRSGTGMLSRADAQAARLDLIARHFDRIDTAGTGRVRFDDVLRFLRARGAEL